MENRTLAGELAEILFITSYPPRECGIATYSQDLIKALNNKFSNSFSIKVCALESNGLTFPYPVEVKYILKTSVARDYKTLALSIEQDDNIKIVLIQHEFGFFHKQEQAFLNLLDEISKPVVVVFHTVLPHPDKHLKSVISRIERASNSIVVMTHTSADILTNEYGLAPGKISVIAHGTHLVPHLSKKFLKDKYGLNGRKVLTTFGLLSAGKSIETTLDALPSIVKQSPEVVFLIIGKTHPEVVKHYGEQYREMLEQKVIAHALQDHVIFINNYLSLPDLLEYLQLTDIYLFTSKDPNQAVSGTFVYAMSCACPIISTPIPHAREVLTEDTGIIFDFGNSKQLAVGINRLLNDEPLRRNISTNTLQKIVSTAWENSAVEHAMLFNKITNDHLSIQYDIPAINLSHLNRMTTGKGIIQFSKINQPNLKSGYTLDDNARALIAMCMQYKLTNEPKDLPAIQTYLSFIKACQLPAGNFLNYMHNSGMFTRQNQEENLDDSNGRAVWALGYLISLTGILPGSMISEAEAIFEKAQSHLFTIHSTRAMAFAIKGLYYFQQAKKSTEKKLLLQTLANRLVQMYRHESTQTWAWFEGYLTYANSILPEALLYSWLLTREPVYKEIALTSFEFLLSKIFNENGIEVISNRTWLHRGVKAGHFGEQPIDVAYTIMTLSKFYDVFMGDQYHTMMETAFNWFLGKNRLHQIVYNPCTGGCYDGLEEANVNLNQGAESTVSYLMARLTMEKYKSTDRPLRNHLRNQDILHTKQRKRIYSTNHKKIMLIENIY